MSQKRKPLIVLALLALFALYYANICFFYHSHIINGTTIVHSHFHDEAHAQSGTHSESEITLISALSSFQSLQATLWFVGVGIFFLLQTFILPVFEKIIISKPVACVSLRAPPALS
jgi:hypothetical protein